MATIFASSVNKGVLVLPVGAARQSKNSFSVDKRCMRIPSSSGAFEDLHRGGKFSSTLSMSKGRYAARARVVLHAGGEATPLYSGSDSAANSIAPITIYTAFEGKPVQFQDLWDQKNGMALVAFLRHFGCTYCWEFAGQLRDAKPTLDATGVKLITIGVGKPDKAQLMAEKINFPIECLYCDDDRKAYRALELPGDAGTFFFPKKYPIPKLAASWGSIQKVLSNGYQVSAPDDKTGVMQQGGLYVFKGQEVLYARKEEHVGDHPDLKEVLGVCCTIPEYA
ncbi:unnamed protein product [Calypogeia fissa]